MNEGHSAFLQLERLRELVRRTGIEPEPALERLRGSTVFTTHTPVPAGNEVFDPELVRRNVGHLVDGCRLSWEEFLALGKMDPGDTVFGLTPFALRTSACANGVSELHGAVSREMWHALWPDRPVDQVPITSITNGVHGRTWISDELEDLLGQVAPDFARALRALRRAALVAPHRAAKLRMLEFVARTRGAHRPRSGGADDRLRAPVRDVQARDLLFRRPDRLLRLLGDPDRPVQFLVAGKAHPADDGGKDVIQHVVEFARDVAAGGRVVFLEDYEMMLARRLVQGVDVWLNTPRRPMEASGTSGMKAALNGVLNCSILDGWWAEGYAERGRVRDRRLRGSRRPTRSRTRPTPRRSYALLEQQVIPPYYERDERRATGALDRDDAALDRRARHAVQHEPHGDRVRRAALPTGAPRPARPARHRVARPRSAPGRAKALRAMARCQTRVTEPSRP